MKVGSLAYTEQLQQAFISNATPQHCQALLKQLFRQLGAYFDSHGDLKLTNKFASSLNPQSSFFRVLAQIVQTAFPAGLAAGPNATLALRRMVHQMRYYLDLINVHYLRQRYPTAKNDWARLVAFDIDCYHAQQPMSRPEPARLHNKLDRQLNLPLTPGWNIKRVYDFHVEFILDQAGNFMYLDLTDIGQADPGQIINCSSFNYAERNDNIHRKLDVYYNTPTTRSKDPWLRTFWLQSTRSPAKQNRYNQLCETKRQLAFQLERWYRRVINS